MDRTTRTLIVVGVAVLVAAAASFGVYRAIQQMPVREVEVRSVSQVVAVHDMPMGTLITQNDVKVVSWPASSPVQNGFGSVEKVVNRGLVSGVVANEPLTESKLAPLEAGAGLPPSITEGMRALSIRVNEVVGVAGFVVPGTHVDVLVTLNEGQNDSLTRVVVSDVQVLTAGTRYDQQKARDGQPIPTSVVTLLLDPLDAERVTLASQRGSLMLTLRNPLDRQATESKGVRTGALFGAAPDPLAEVRHLETRKAAVRPPPPPTPPPPPPPAAYVVETYKAAKRAEEVVK
jgi:pilus assembly protein CpaB